MKQFLLFLFAAVLCSAGPILNVIDLGSLGGSCAAAFGLNDSGVAAGTATTVFGYEHAFVASNGAMTDLTLNSGASQGFAAAINNAGTIAGTQIINGQAVATVWSSAGASSISGAGSYAMAINDAGQVAGMLTTTDGPNGGQGHAFVTTNGVAQDLGTVPGGSWSSAYGINGSGEAVGYGMTSSGGFRGFTWTSSGGINELGTLGGANSYAMAVNDAGTVVGSAQLASGAMHAFIANGDALIDLGTLGGVNSYAYSINDVGEAVGYSTTAAGAMHAFLYEGGVMIDLNSMIDPASGWIVTNAYAINASGEIAGAGLFDGVEHAFLLEPSASPALFSVTSQSAIQGAAAPEPRTVALLMMLFAAGAIRIRFRALLPRLHAFRQRELV